MGGEHRFGTYIWLTAIVPLVFWLVDGSFRRTQRSFIARVEQLSQYVNSEAFLVAASSGSNIALPLLIMRAKTDASMTHCWEQCAFSLSHCSMSALPLAAALFDGPSMSNPIERTSKACFASFPPALMSNVAREL
jgi:hypothetical protein